MPEDIAQRGKAGEEALNDWFREQSLSYVRICQSTETFSPLFTGSVKRPDFLVLLESIGLIAVDAKNYTCSNGEYTLTLEDELKRAVAFERLFRIPLWYAYMAMEEQKVAWYWISALKAVEVGAVRKNAVNNKEFVAIKLGHFERLETRADFGKLYTHRLPGASVIKSL